MKLVKNHAFINPDGAASILLPVELHALLQLDAWAFRLFAALVKLADFKTGKGQCNYPSLLAWMTAPKNETGGQQPATYSRQQVVRMLRSMEAVGLLTLNRDASQAEKVIFFEVRARDWKSAFTNRRERRSERPQPARKAHEQRELPISEGQSRTTKRTGIQSSSKTLHSIKEGSVDKLSTAPGGTQELAPPGGQEWAPAGPTPPQEALTGDGEWVRVGEHVGPPGGQESAPDGARPPWAEVGDGWRHGPPLPMNARGVDMTDPANWPRDESGALIPPIGHGIRGRASRNSGGPRRVGLS